MTTLDPTQAELLRRSQDDRLQDDFKVEVGTVVAYYESTNEADVKIAAQRPALTTDGEITYEQPPILPHVPMVALGTSRSLIQIPLEPGDCVLLLFTGRSPAEFLEGSTDYEPADLSRHSLSNGFGVPFVRPGGTSGGKRLALLEDVQAVLDLLKATYAVVAGDGGASWQAALITAATATTLTGTSEVEAK